MIYDPLTAPGPGEGLAHTDSYWADTAGPAVPDDGPLTESADTDVAIIGGGYTGLSCAAHLARRYGARPIVLEANRPAWGCSGRNGSFARPILGRVAYQEWIRRWGEESARGLFGECLEALGTVRDLIREGDIDCDAQPEGSLRIAHSRRRVGDLEADQRLLADTFGYSAEVLYPDTLAKQHFNGEEAHAALRMPDGFGVHPLKLGHGILRMARGAGANVYSASPVEKLAKHDGCHVLKTPRGEVRAKAVVFATNGYTPEQLHPSLRGGLLPLVSNIIVTRPMTGDEQAACNFVTTHVMYDTRKFLNYFRLLPDRRILFGCRGPIRPTARNNAAHRVWLLATLKRKFPALRDITADYFWGGWVAITRDSMPHIAHAEDDPTVHYSLGYCGSGVAAANHAGRRIAEHLAGNRPPLPILSDPMPRIPLAAFRRLTQRLAFMWYRLQDAVS